MSPDKTPRQPRYSRALVEFLATQDFTPESFHVALRAFLLEKDRELSPYSVIHLYASLRPLADFLNNPLLAAVSYADLREYVDGLYRRLKPGTIKPIVGDIRQFFKWAKRRKWIRRNPAKRLQKPSKRTLARTAKPKAVNEATVKQLITHLTDQLSHLVYRGLFGLHTDTTEWSYEDQERIRDLFIIVFVYETGCRAGELWRLSSRAMDEAVSKSAPVYEVVSIGKTGDNLLRFTVATAELWQIWRVVRPPGYDEYAVVGWKKGRAPLPMQTGTISQAIVRRCKAAGLSPFRAHALRHMKIKRSRQLFGLEIASRLIGHSGLEVTSTYGNDEEQETLLREAATETGLKYRLWA